MLTFMEMHLHSQTKQNKETEIKNVDPVISLYDQSRECEHPASLSIPIILRLSPKDSTLHWVKKDCNHNEKNNE